MEYFNRLPSDITSDILSRLPTESVLECKLVCRNWSCLVRNPSFSKMHLNHHLNHPSDPAADSGELGFIVFSWVGNDEIPFYYFEYHELTEPPIQRIARFNFIPPLEPVRFVGSCHGLICLGKASTTCICNPITKEFVMLPEIRYIQAKGFNYVSSTNEYKVLGTLSNAECTQVYIYTLGSGNGWRYTGDFSRSLNLDCSKTCFANGALYWLNHELEMITTFDLAEERFGEHLSPPPLPQASDWYAHRIGVLDGVLFFAVSKFIEEFERFDIWLLKNKNDDKEEGREHQSLGWSKEFRTLADYDLLTVTKNDRVLTYDTRRLNIHDTKTSTSKSLVRFRDWLIVVSPHKNTFVSLKELGEEDTKTMESVEFEETDEDEDDPEYIYL